MFKYKENKIGHPERDVQTKIVKRLRMEGWYVRVMHAGAKNSGWPDLWATHSRYGVRWIEVKLPKMKGSKFTPAQLEDFPKFTANGAAIWILTGDTDQEFNKLYLKPNWHTYLDVFK